MDIEFDACIAHQSDRYNVKLMVLLFWLANIFRNAIDPYALRANIW